MSAQPRMQARHGPDPILERVSVTGSVSPALARVRMAQSYRNASDANVEIIYTFPLPPQATLLDAVVVLDGKRYRGRVMPKAHAEQGYEEAIAKGDTALMVERPEPGLYVMDLGNLMAGESAIVEVELGMLLDWHGDRMRLSLPMTLAPRYGEERSALQDQQKPRQDLLVERAFTLALRLSADFIDSRIESPTHRIAVRSLEHEVEVRLERPEAWMDRDFVLTAQSKAAPRPFGCFAPDGEAHVFHGAFQIPPANAVVRRRSVKIVLDCSGSMNGDSIGIARTAVIRLLERLTAEDELGLVAFGSNSVAWHPSMRRADELDVEAAIRWVRERQADMGGTEMAAALGRAMAIQGASASSDVFLITDGQVARIDEVVDRAQSLGQRIFVIGIGAAPQQDLLRRIAETTGGGIEWAAPGELISDAVHRLFARLTEVPVSDLRLVAEEDFEWQARSPALAAFSGDTIHVFARSQRPPGPVAIEWRQPDGKTQRLPLAAAPVAGEHGEVIARIAAATRIHALEIGGGSDAEIAELAVRYQLVTSTTNYLLVVARGEDAASDMPVMRRVSHMMAGGCFLSSVEDIGGFMPVASRKMAATREHLDLGGLIMGRAEVAATPPSAAPFATFLARANEKHASLVHPAPLPRSISELEAMGLPSSEAASLRRLARAHPEEEIVLAFWAVVLERAEATAIGRGLRRALATAGLPQRVRAELVASVLGALGAWVPAAEAAS